MPNNDVVLLDRILESASQTAPAGLSADELFEFFTAEQIFKDYGLSSEEVLAGITDGNGDGGIDSIYTFANETLVDEDFDHTVLPRGYALDLFVVQSKMEAAFGEDVLDKLVVSLPHLLDLTNQIDTALYSNSLIGRVGIFRDLLEKTAGKFPKVRLHIIYASKGSTRSIHQRVVAKQAELKSKAEDTISGCEVELRLEGAKELREMASRVPSEVLSLEFEGYYSKPGQNSYLALVPISKYAEFLSDDTGKLRRLIFESNVRDYQGTTQVNQSIKDSLAAPYSAGDPDFWWLNNGITIICTQANITGQKFTLKDAQIVNGLQTSVAVYDHFRGAGQGTVDQRVVLVRIITASNDDVRNSIILATNRQNSLPPFAMRATDSWQKSIELFFESKGYYYDRRKSYYKNQGKPAELIVTIPYLAQATLSIGFGQPDDARARPSTLIVNNTTYRKIFNDQSSLDGYVWMAKLQKKVDAYLRSSSFDQTFKSNMRFHLSMMVAQDLLGAQVHAPSQLQPYFAADVDESAFADPVSELQGYINEFMRANPDVTLDKVAKSKEFTDFVNTQRYTS